jgi:adenine-specific DNA-methyltransferase
MALENSIETTGVKFIGSKALLVSQIVAQIQLRFGTETPLRVIDCFTGTTRVAQAFRQQGWEVQSSDLSWAAEAYAEAFLRRTAESGARIPALLQRLREIGASATQEGWLTKHYCDVSGATGGLVRMWQRKNGIRADAVRDAIAAWETAGEITEHEAMILVTCLIFALDRVDNSVGIQQAYLKTWAKRTENDLDLQDVVYPIGPIGKHLVGDCLALDYESADVAYLDPPYSSHSYASYYHIWDSITRWDKPAVGLTTNRRIDRVSSSGVYDAAMISPWNRRGGALPAFLALVARLPVLNVLISYNDESIVALDDLLKGLRAVYGTAAVSMKRIPYKRNIMATIGNAELYTDEHKTENTEVLIWVDKTVSLS